jgi:hypothetical protein
MSVPTALRRHVIPSDENDADDGLVHSLSFFRLAC